MAAEVPTAPSTRTLGKASAIAAVASRSVGSATSNATNRCRRPVAASAASSRRVFSEVPEPSSTSVSAPLSAAISVARAPRIARSARVG